MLIFVFCLFCIGAILSVFVRFPLLVLVTLLAAIVTPIAVASGIIEKDLVGSTLGAFFLPVFVLQVGYGAGIVVNAWSRSVLKSRRPIETHRPTAESSTSSDGRPQIDPTRSV